MSAYERVISLCKKEGIAPTALESKLGFGRGSIGKMQTSEMKYSRLKKIADYFSVPVEYFTAPDSDEIMDTLHKAVDGIDAAQQAVSNTIHTAHEIADNLNPDERPESQQNDSIEWGYYIDPETAKFAQSLFEQPGMRILFDAAQDSKPEDMEMAAKLLERLKATNPDG